MKLSKFGYLFEDHEKKYVIQTKNKRLFEIDDNVFEAIKEKNIAYLNAVDIFELLVESGILIHDEVDEAAEIYAACKQNDDKEEWNSLHIIPTVACNMGCEYCFVLKDMANNTQDVHAISKETLHQGIDLFFEKNTCDQPIVTFYGGEPLIHPEVIYDAIDYIENTLGRKIRKKIITNGTLVTEEIAEYLYEHDFDVNISIDGNRTAHDVFRTYKGGGSTYDDTIKGLKLLKQAGNSIKVLMTVGDHNIDYLMDCVTSILEYEPTTIALNLPKQLQNSDNEIEHNLNYSDLMEKYFECVDYCYEKKIPEAHLADIIFGFLRDEVQYHPCYGCGKQMAFTPDGRVGPCQAYLSTGKYFVKMTNGLSANNLRNMDEFLLWESITMPGCTKCASCYLLPMCPGDCPFDWENRTGSFEAPPDTYCFTRKAMFDYILRRIVNGKNILFRG